MDYGSTYIDHAVFHENSPFFLFDGMHSLLLYCRYTYYTSIYFFITIIFALFVNFLGFGCYLLHYHQQHQTAFGT